MIFFSLGIHPTIQPIYRDEQKNILNIKIHFFYNIHYTPRAFFLSPIWMLMIPGLVLSLGISRYQAFFQLYSDHCDTERLSALV